jgi:hypothetical protein
MVFFFFANSIIILAREYNFLIYFLDNTLLIYFFIILFPSCYIFVRGQKKVYNFLLIISYNPINNIQANCFCFIGY